MSLNDIVSVLISAETAQVTRTGFGTPMILSGHALFTDLVREYTTLAGLVADGFTSGKPEYKAANALFAQSPRPKKVKIGRRGTPSTLKYTITPTPIADATAYRVTINGVAYTVTSAASATATTIVAQLLTALNISAHDNIVTATGTATLILTADSAAAWFDVDVDRSRFTIVCDNAATNLGDDLAAIALDDNDFYGIVSTHRSTAEITAIALWAEANGKLFVAASSDTAIPAGTGGNIALVMEAAAYARIAVAYHQFPAEFMDAAWLGRCLPLTPGSETWKFKTLAGVTADTLTATQRSNILAAKAAVYTTVGGVNITEEGVTSYGEFIDNRRFLDWCAARIQEDVFSLLARTDKLPYTDAGGQGLASVVRAVLEEGVRNGGFSADPGREPTVTVPLVADQPSADRLARNFPDITWRAYLAGAVHSAEVQGTVSV